MGGEEIRVNWRALIVPKGLRPIHGRLRKLSMGKVTVSADHNMIPGHHCNLALLLPKNSPDLPNRYVEGRGVVVVSVLSAMQFHLTVEWLELKANGAQLLNDQIRLHGYTWKSQH